MPDTSASRPKRLPRDAGKTYDLGFKTGRSEGFQECQQEVLGFLQAKYIDDPNRPDRGTPKAEVILELAKELSTFTNDLKQK